MTQPKNFSPLFLLLVTTQSCAPAPEEAPSASNDKISSNSEQTTEVQDRLLSRYMGVDDPNRDPNWDWTALGEGHTLYYTHPSGGIRSTVRQLPFYTPGHPLNTLQKDMYPQDGWILAFRDFGTPNAAPDLPYVVLYNRYRGILRVMLFNTREFGYSQFNLELSFKDPTASGALMTFSNSAAPFLVGYAASAVENFMFATDALNGWLYSDFMLTGYDPILDDSAQLRLRLRGLNTANLSLHSTRFSLNEIMTDSNPGGSSSGDGGDLIDAAKKGHKFYSEVNKAVAAMKDAADKQENENKWWKPVVGAITGAIGGIAPWVAGAVGFISEFIGGAKKPAPREPLRFEGSLELTGTISQSTPLYSLDLGTKFYDRSTPPPGCGGIVGCANPPDHDVPVNPIPWGIFNLRSKPEIITVREWRCIPTSSYGIRNIAGHAPPCLGRTELMLTLYSRDQTPEYVFNPDAGLTLASVKYAFTYDDRKPDAFALELPVLQGDAYRNPNGIAVEVRMRAQEPTLHMDREIVFYKVYPVTRTFRLEDAL